MEAGRVDRVDTCDLRLGTSRWLYANRNSAAIESHWGRRQAENPAFFNGRIHVARDCQITGRHLKTTLIETDFKSFLYWREQGYPEAGALDAFGSAILRSCDGAVLLVRQRPGNVNEGQVYLPGGFIDARDVAADGSVDIAASIARELTEETHLDIKAFDVQPGFLAVRCGALLSIGQVLVSRQGAEQLRAAILANLAADPDPELADIVIIRHPGDLAHHAVPPYARLAVNALFSVA